MRALKHDRKGNPSINDNDNLLPPIFVTPDLRLVGLGLNPDGTSWMRFTTIGRSSNPVREAVVTVRASTKFVFEYSIYDASLQTINQYRGEYGDPTRDEWLGSFGLQRRKPSSD